MQPNPRLNQDYGDKNPAEDFHRRYRGIIGSSHGLCALLYEKEIPLPCGRPHKGTRFPCAIWVYSTMRGG